MRTSIQVDRSSEDLFRKEKMFFDEALQGRYNIQACTSGGTADTYA
jgi:hypothetical protein